MTLGIAAIILWTYMLFKTAFVYEYVKLLSLVFPRLEKTCLIQQAFEGDKTLTNEYLLLFVQNSKLHYKVQDFLAELLACPFCVVCLTSLIVSIFLGIFYFPFLALGSIIGYQCLVRFLKD